MAAKKTTKSKSRKPKDTPAPAPVPGAEPDLFDGIDLQGLTPLQSIFIREFFRNGCDGTKAIRVMGHESSDTCARTRAAHYRRQPAVRRVIDEIMTGFAMTGAEAMAELSSVAFMRTHFEVEDGRILETDPRNVKNKVTALQTVLKYHGLLKDNLKLDIDVTKLNDAELEQLRATLGGGGRDRGAEATTTESRGEDG